MNHTAAMIVLALGLAAPASAETYHLYLLAGQSNMEGFGYTRDLPGELTGTVDGARIYLGRTTEDGAEATGAGIWAEVEPGFGTGATTDGERNALGERFGPELTFARRLRELRPGENVAIIKYAKGGSGLDLRVERYGTWDPHDRREQAEGARVGVNQYDHALATIAAATAVRDIDGDGEADTLIPAGIVWMQGETDATQAETAADYAANLAEMAALLRAAMRADGLPFVIGRISDRGVNQGTDERVWRFGDALRAAQAFVAEADPAAALVTTTDSYGYSDPYHYDSAGYIDLGEAFAEAVDGLR